MEIQEMKSYDVKAIANFFIERAIEEGKELSPMKLQKLLYFAYGLYLAIHKKALSSDRFEAWKYGPVIRQLYHALKGYGDKSIDSPIFEVTSEGLKLRLVAPRIEDNDENKEVLAFLRDFWKIYKDYTAIQLANASHLSEGPWKKAIDKPRAVIGDEDIRTYFESWLSSK